MKQRFLAALGAVTIALVASAPAAASDANCTGDCGQSLTSNGVVAVPQGQSSYRWVSTYQDTLSGTPSVDGAGEIASAGGTNGSEFVTASFVASAGDVLNYHFDYVTTDGYDPDGPYPKMDAYDYAFAELRTVAGDHIAWLFTAQTNPDGAAVPGVNLPLVDATLDPISAFASGATTWNVLGNDEDGSGYCAGNGCGSTGWISSSYTLAAGGEYVLRFGVTNMNDDFAQSGLAYYGTLGAGTGDPAPLPEPASWAMMIAGFGLTGAALRRRRSIARIA